MLVHESALNHGIEAADAIYAAENWVFAAPQNDDSPMPEFRLGFDSHGRLLELVVLVFDSGSQMLIHAMKARKQYLARSARHSLWGTLSAVGRQSPPESG